MNQLTLGRPRVRLFAPLCTSSQNTCSKTTTRQHIAAETHNLCTHMHTHTYTQAYTCIHIHIHIHMHIYTYIQVCTYTYIHIYAHTHRTCTYAHTQARLERQLGIDFARSPTWSRQVLLFSLSAAIRKGVTFRVQKPNCSFLRIHE